MNAVQELEIAFDEIFGIKAEPKAEFEQTTRIIPRRDPREVETRRMFVVDHIKAQQSES